MIFNKKLINGGYVTIKNNNSELIGKILQVKNHNLFIEWAESISDVKKLITCDVSNYKVFARDYVTGKVVQINKR